MGAVRFLYSVEYPGSLLTVTKGLLTTIDLLLLVLGCPNKMYGQDCSCTSQLSQATCSNGTWTLNGDLQITQDVRINSDTVHILGDFSSAIQNFIGL